ncbi:MAG: ABC transporter permease [Bacteroidales bacterium]|nr:ABC transporter permease [Bacteroidales bacterium]
MSLTAHIAKRLMGQSEDSLQRRKLSGPVVRVSTLAVALGMVVMTIAICIGTGFKEEIRQKIVGFGSNIVISQFDTNQSYETNPIIVDELLTEKLSKVDDISRVTPYIIKAGIIKTKEAVQAIALKGVDYGYDSTFVRSILQEGRILHDSTAISVEPTDGIMLSCHIASVMGLKIGDPVRIYFVQNGIRARKFTLIGLFDSHFTEFDDRYAFVDIRQLRRLNAWEDNHSTGLEIGISRFDKLDDVASDVLHTVMYYSEELEDGDPALDQILRIQTIRDTQAQLFAWLDLLDTNILVILVLIIAVASLNMISGLLILILENTSTIGLLKTMGARNSLIRQIFIRMATSIIGKGMIWGNIVGLGLCAIQYFTGLIPLDPANYYLDHVPISFEWIDLIGINIISLAVTTLALFGPSFVISKIRPASAIRMD